MKGQTPSLKKTALNRCSSTETRKCEVLVPANEGTEALAVENVLNPTLEHGDPEMKAATPHICIHIL